MGRIRLLNGLSLAFQQWGETSLPGARILCLHGWLDNSNSFNHLGATLGERGYHVVAVDHAGHGLSDHTGRNSLGQFSAYVSHVKGVLDHLGWEQANVIGHSMVS